MNKIEMSKNPDYCFAALKLIEQLYKDGKVPNFMYRNILNEKEANAKTLTQEERRPAKGHALPCGESFLSVNVGTNSACGFGTEKTGWQMPHISATALFIPAPTKVGKSVDFHLTEYAKPR